MSTPLTLIDLLELDSFRRTQPEVVCGEHLLDRPVRWVHTSELAEAATLLRGEELLLTSGLGLSGRGAPGLRMYIAALGERRAALAMELGWTFTQIPTEMLHAAREHDVPVIAIHNVVPFVELAETAQEAILTRRLRASAVGAASTNSAKARLLNDLETSQVSGPALTRRLAAVGITAVGQSFCGVVIRGFRLAMAAAVEESLSRVVETHSVLSASGSGEVVAVMPADAPHNLGSRLLATLDELMRSQGEAATCRIALGRAGPMLEAAPRLAEARNALSLAASLGIEDRVLMSPLISGRMALNRLAGDVLAERLVHTEIGKLIEHDARHGTHLVRTLHTYLIHSSQKQAAAEALSCSRQALYKRLATISRLTGPFELPHRHADLIIALELHLLQRRSD
ncbi:PucR family transcriptional regulator [Aeromicrobium piscarium]|uniref:PucR family transcriptional regulator n=1 Tax=Aeromicrobium piscarium TaxID=2590901 RepID=A0A554SCX0_9ACTN|nr:PucR family transcriptional regulator ligand-binding domain-containing protein [Aeromicrobium piscarium]TSD64204.1 hypothetical protein FNM00_06530 [Aeromicrobium piscarium]